MKIAYWGWLVLAMAALCIPGSAQAATINWASAQNISAPSDVSGSGVLVDAIRAYSDNAGGYPTLSVNGVAFQGTNFTTVGSIYSLSDGTGDIVLRADSADIDVSPPNTAELFPTTSNTGDANYDALLSRLSFTVHSGTAILNNLIIGHTYQVEFWSNQQNAATNGAVLSGTPSVSLAASVAANTDGQFALGTFTADAGSLSFTYTPNTVGAIVNAVQLRDISAPEPSSIVLFALGGAGLCYVARRRVRKPRTSNQ